MLFNNVAVPFVVRVTCRGMFEEEELLPENPDDDSASGSVNTTSTPTRRGRKRSRSSLEAPVAQRSKMLNKKERICSGTLTKHPST